MIFRMKTSKRFFNILLLLFKKCWIFFEKWFYSLIEFSPNKKAFFIESNTFLNWNLIIHHLFYTWSNLCREENKISISHGKILVVFEKNFPPIFLILVRCIVFWAYINEIIKNLETILSRSRIFHPVPSDPILFPSSHLNPFHFICSIFFFFLLLAMILEACKGAPHPWVLLWTLAHTIIPLHLCYSEERSGRRF